MLDPTVPLVDMAGIGRRYGAFEALSSVNLRVERGSYICIRGPSGSGKSTLMNVIGLLDVATDGNYRFDGADVGSLKERHQAAIRATQMGFVFQAFHLMPYRNVLENVGLSLVYAETDPSGRHGLATAALERVGLSSKARSSPRHLSGGESQRVAIARAIASAPALLLCDEPTGNLDSVSSGVVLDLLDELRTDGTTIVLITHDDSVAARADSVLTMLDGRLVGGDVAQIP